MSRKGNCLDNAALERFFGTLRSEFFYLNRFANTEELQAGRRRCIHCFNHQRLKLELNGLSPVQYRIQALSCRLSTVQLLGVGSLRGEAVAYRDLHFFSRELAADTPGKYKQNCQTGCLPMTTLESKRKQA